jgi:hypothetical protein
MAKILNTLEVQELEFFLVKVNSGKAIHLAWKFEGAYGTSISTQCGSGEGTPRTTRYYKVVKEVNPENITCKKCRKAYEDYKAQL